MSTVIGQAWAAPLRATKKESADLFLRAVNSTADGVIDTALSTYSDPGCLIARTGAGTYSVTYPACPSDVNLQLDFTTHTGTPNVFWCRCTAFAPTLGTATLVTSVAAGGAAADNNSAGMNIFLRLCGAVRAGN